MKNGSSTWLVKGVLVGATLVACLALLEVGLRLLGRYPGNTLEGFFEQGGMSYRLRTNTTKRINWPTMSFTVHTDDLGFRAKKPGPRPLGERPYYAVVGSSEVFGNGLDYEQTFIGAFAANMERHGIDVANMAVGGQSLDEQSFIFKEFVASVRHYPKAVLVCLNPLLIGEFDEHHPDLVVRHGHLFQRDNWKKAFVKMILQNKSTVYCFFRDTIRKAQVKHLSRKDFDVSYYFDIFSATNRIRTPERREEFLGRLRDLEQRIRSVGATPVFVYSPVAGGFMLNKLKAEGKLDASGLDTGYFVDLVRTHCAREGILFINVEPELQKLYDKGEKLNLDLDGHFNAPTSRVMGDHIYVSLKQAGVLD